MKRIPVDVAGLEFRAVEDIAPKLKNRETGEMKVNAAGVPVYEVLMTVKGEGRRTELMAVSLPTNAPPDVRAGQVVALEGLTGFFWETSGRAGVSFSVTAIAPVLDEAGV
ncbi:hypothetical protein AGRA3207_007553 [Actinomadura graeca]|uniref:Regulatory protein n=1 Tax=Actinomadura graeca TaxID=2750812 RepID=A0ABX8R4I4_9ACTN|nr:hypothetical protein [Actinomadura graeca]QXJ25980.1 hypothetical protein AGRA3207_007553 [Actinomadura graeca]